MNKDVIYIEPEDDITDIITKLENSKEKIVALVPPKKAGVFRSVVNIKLIAKAAAGTEKTAVLVTTDPSIVKLAAATRIPVTKNLQTPPTIPNDIESEEQESVSTEEVVEATDEDDMEKNVTEEVETKEDVVEDDKDDDQDDKKSDKKKLAKEKKKSSDGKKFNNPVFCWIAEHKKISIACGIGFVILILILIWAFVIAPAATITVGIRTTTSNFSENVTFTDKLSDENIDEGKFYLEEKKIESKSEVEFNATGSKNIGEKATGEVVVYTYFREKGMVAVNAGSMFTIGGLAYTANEETSLSWNGESQNECDNNGEASAITSGCMIAKRVAVTATMPGSNYNIAASNTGWSTVANVAGVYSDQAMNGGTDELVTIVQQSDIDGAVAKMKTENEVTNKEKLFDTIEEGAFIIESSFKQTTGDAVSKPALGEVVEEGKKAKLTVVTTDSVYIIDKTKAEEFITKKAKLAENYKIYSMNDPFIENFTKTDDGYVGKMKTSYVSGPKVTENDIVEMVRGKGTGTAQHDLKDAFDGISSIDIKTSFPWVTSIPNDENKIKVEMNIEGQ
ncbi:hypothetical protein IJJ36_00710 [Candidatus Saccharibacteria bacterium]|nr:hypothetical protein [Candidatus Saccharibacteria bacterium]